MHTKTIDHNTVATHPGRVVMSREKLKAFHPELFSAWAWRIHLLRYGPMYPIKDREFWITYVEEHLMYGDSHAAVVVSAAPLVVAAYSEELDCVALPQFDDRVAARHGLSAGARLLTVNTYDQTPEDFEPDLTFGPGHHRRYGNFSPHIADFLTDDEARLRERKREISEEKWLKAERLGRERLGRGVRPRDGRPLWALFSRVGDADN